ALQASTWALASIEGYTFDASADGLPTAQLGALGQPDWIVLVDGQRVPLRVAGTRLLELLPISLAQVERIVVSRDPRLVAGTLASRGVIEVHTRRHQRPLARGSYAIGNERGDPGPYRYTDRASANVERLGPDAMALLAAGGARGDVQVGARYSTLNVTDEALLPRLAPDIGAFRRDLFQRVVSVTWSAALRLGCATQGIVAGRARFEGVLYQPTRDDWTATDLTHAGLSGAAPVGGTGALRWSLGVQRLDVDTLAPRASSALPHAHTSLLAHVEGESARGRTTLALALAGAHWSIDQAARTSSRGEIGATARVRQSAAFGVVDAAFGALHSGGKTGLHALASLALPLDGANALRLDGAWDARPVDGERWSETAAVDPVLTDVAGPSLGMLGAAWRRADRRGTLTVGADARLARDWSARARAGLVRGDAAVYAAHARVALPEDAPLTASIEYRATLPTSNAPALDDVLAATPRHAARATAGTGRLPGNFRLSGAFLARSATRWPAIDDSARAPRTLPALVRLDASVEKWLWRDRAHLFLAARNLLDRTERHHPEGAHFALRVHLGADVTFGAGR
ncbi:MAG TPA: TonB-dependent receptor, partial [Gemmatimonadaceae bacterium]|nr:TonB-dependent receptor [Gemmatimonadaceae bacterium]